MNATSCKSPKIIPSKKSQSFPITKISSRKTKKITHLQNILLMWQWLDENHPGQPSKSSDHQVGSS